MKKLLVAIIFLGGYLAHGQTPFDPPHDDDPIAKSILNLKVYLEGYYSGSGLMQPVLQNQLGSGNSTITDEITVELRKVTDGTLRASKNVNLNTNGTTQVQFDGDVIGNYFIVIKHRNTIQTWSSGAINISPLTTAFYDFTTSTSKAFGDNQKEVAAGVYALFSGDVNQDGILDLLDYFDWENDYNNFSTGYFATDINGDGLVDLIDSISIEVNTNNFIFSQFPTF